MEKRAKCLSASKEESLYDSHESIINHYTCLLLIFPLEATMVGNRKIFCILISPNALSSMHPMCEPCILYDLEPDLGQGKRPPPSLSYARKRRKNLCKIPVTEFIF